MWRQIAAVVIFLQLSTFAAIITPNHEVALNCDPIRDSDELFTVIDCFLIEVKSSNDQVLVATTSLDMNELNSENKTIWIDIAGNANYPEYFPKNLSKTINGVGFFFYKKTPLKYVTRDDLKDLASGLTRLVLEENELTDVQYDTFYDLHKLEYLDIRFNHIKSLPSNLFENSPNLNSFWIESNEISALHPDLFKNCPNFEILYAEFNKIEEFHEDLLKNNPKMIIISMRHNRIKNIPYDFTKFEFLEVADFTHNGGTCDTMFFDFHPYDEYYDENEQKKWIKTVPEFQKKVEETCRD